MRKLFFALVLLFGATGPAIAQSEHPLLRGRILPCNGMNPNDCARAKNVRIDLLVQSMRRCLSNNIAECGALLAVPDLSATARRVATISRNALHNGQTFDQWLNEKFDSCRQLDSTACDEALSVLWDDSKERSQLLDWREQALRRIEQNRLDEERRQQAERAQLEAEQQLLEQHQREIEEKAERQRQQEAELPSIRQEFVPLGILLLVSFLIVLVYPRFVAWAKLRGGGPVQIAGSATANLSPGNENSPPSALRQTGLRHPPPLVSGPHNTAHAVAAMELAQSYLQELDGLIPKVMGEPLLANTMLNTLSLASKQIAIAENADPAAMLTFDADGATLTCSIKDLKSQALFAEALARGARKPKRAIPILEMAAALTPTAPLIYFWLGNFHGLLHNKRQAVEAYEKAVALEPKNLDYRKELDRARNMAWSQIAVAKSFRGARTAVTAARIAVILVALAIVAGVFITYGPGNVFFAVLCIVVLGVGAKIHGWASR